MPTQLVDTRPAYRRALGRSYWFVVNRVRTIARDVRKTQHGLLYKARKSPKGRRLLQLLELSRDPRDLIRRRRTAAAFTSAQGPARMSRVDGYVLFQPGELDLGPAADVALSLFERKKDQVKADEQARTDKQRKRLFLRNLLSNDDLARYPELVRFALSDCLLREVIGYLRTVPHLNRVDLLHSVPRDADDTIASQLYHLDPEGFTQAKLFVNLNDVGPDEGPFTFIPAAESARIVREIAARRRARGEPNIGRYTDAEIAEVGGLASQISLTGPRGTAAIIDTSRCLHCGSRVKPGTYRLCLYIQFCTSREHGNLFDLKPFREDGLRRLLLENSQRARGDVAAPHAMDN